MATNRYSENLPEVVPDSSPQPLTYAEEYERRGLDQGDQKYTVIYDLNTPKFATSVPGEGEGTTPTSPAPAYRAALASAHGAPSTAGTSPDVEDIGKSEKAFAGSGERKILGLKRRTFFIVLIAVVLVIVAAIGGGVGGFHAGKQNASGSDSGDVAEEASSPAATTEPGAAHESSVAGSSDDNTSDDADDDDNSNTDGSNNDDARDDEPSEDESDSDSSRTDGSDSDKPSPTSSKTTPSPTGGGGSGDSDDDKADDDEEEEADDDKDDNDNRPKPGFKFRGWKNANFKGSATDIILTTGFLDLPFDVTSYKWHPEGTDCCVTMCQGKKNDVGWRCTNFEREKATANFDRIFIGCGAEASQESSRCS